MIIVEQIPLSEFIVCSTIPFSGDSFCMKTHQLICIVNKWAGLYVVSFFAERYFHGDFSFLYSYISKYYVLLFIRRGLAQWPY